MMFEDFMEALERVALGIAVLVALAASSCRPSSVCRKLFLST